MYQLTDYSYDLPKELIAQYPNHPRDASRLMIVHRKSGTIEHAQFRDIVRFFKPDDQLIFNNTKVFPARFIGRKASGAKAELLLLKQISCATWEALVKPSRKFPAGAKMIISSDFYAEILEEMPEGRKIVELHSDQPLAETIEKYGRIPLPGYIARSPQADDSLCYQTVYAEKSGAAAAPTAGLHFTQELLNTLESRGVERVPVTLHVGLGTFKPVQAEDIRQHRMHSEQCDISLASAKLWNRGKKHWQLAVGTTTSRILESAVRPDGLIDAGTFETSLFIYPGYRFSATQALLTNFHLPQSSLLMLVCAFGGYELIREAYSQAIQEKYRFFSYGDAMLIL
jgi:S-adenosylmethionine:tRNA ribosyltransferase-isomerase